MNPLSNNKEKRNIRTTQDIAHGNKLQVTAPHRIAIQHSSTPTMDNGSSPLLFYCLLYDFSFEGKKQKVGELVN
jgi:hypothetical protein